MSRIIEKISLFIQESRQELKKVNWPSKNETVRYTTFVIIVSIAIALFLGLGDSIFIYLVKFLVS